MAFLSFTKIVRPLTWIRQFQDLRLETKLFFFFNYLFPNLRKGEKRFVFDFGTIQSHTPIPKRRLIDGLEADHHQGYFFFSSLFGFGQLRWSFFANPRVSIDVLCCIYDYSGWCEYLKQPNFWNLDKKMSKIVEYFVLLSMTGFESWTGVEKLTSQSLHFSSQSRSCC